MIIPLEYTKIIPRGQGNWNECQLEGHEQQHFFTWKASSADMAGEEKPGLPA
ncbi:MAG: hypothetical protein GY754_46705 [bacterium]|nr:hypothetical protein [bacterium]